MDDATVQSPQHLEAARLRALRALHALDSGSDTRFDRIARTAALIMKAPRAAIVLVDEDRLWHKARIGIPSGEYARAGTLADHMVQRATTLISSDIRSDPRLTDIMPRLPMVDVRFYAGAPLIAPGGEVIGLLAVGDPEAHAPHDESEQLALEDLASLTMDLLLHDSENIEAERRAKLDQQRVELALDAAGLGEFELDLIEGQIFISDRMKSLIGAARSSASLEGDAIYARFIHPEDFARAMSEARASLATDSRYLSEARVLRADDNRQRWMQSAGVMVRARDGTPLRVIGVLRDITEAKAEAEHREVLLAELDHRVKNVLAAVQSLAAQSARRTTSTDGFLSAFAGRLKAMASAHELLTATRWRGASLAHIAAAELGGLAPGQARWEGPVMALTPRAANAASLALHELATNAVKYGALSVDSGRVEVRWTLSPGGGFTLDWVESGGPRVVAPDHRGFGSTLLEQVTGRELGGEVLVEYRPDGLRAKITADAGALADDVGGTSDEPTLDQADASAGASLGQPAGEAQIEGLRVLVVEDAVLLALELEAGLEEAGAIVVGNAAELEEGMAMLSLTFDAAVLDANLNGASVAPLAQALADRGTPFVFATGYGERGAPEGFDVPVVRKPYNIHQIVRALAEAVGAKAGD